MGDLLQFAKCFLFSFRQQCVLGGNEAYLAQLRILCLCILSIICNSISSKTNQEQINNR